MSTTELAWFKSSYSGSQGDDCIEVAVTEQAVRIRDSKDVSRPHFASGRRPPTTSAAPAPSCSTPSTGTSVPGTCRAGTGT
ncbi:DUF397 domain-containing protein [Streptomyces sp. NPDC007901]|uniref:DUF397 domain-containing protein n=1 Tax=Streptomyces sp. NPDC007901 TaxID=3364785 RepID=UPI0036EB6196